MIHKPKIVMIGGGTGLPEILHGLRDKDVDVTAIVTVADDGGSSGILRNYVNVVPPGDIRNALVALSELSELELEIFQYRFNSTDQFLAGHAIGNLIISALAEMSGANPGSDASDSETITSLSWLRLSSRSTDHCRCSSACA